MLSLLPQTQLTKEQSEVVFSDFLLCEKRQNKEGKVYQLIHWLGAEQINQLSLRKCGIIL